MLSLRSLLSSFQPIRWRSISSAWVTSATITSAMLVMLSGCVDAPEDPDGPHMRFTSGRDTWRTQDVTATLESPSDVTLRIEARHPDTGEQLTFLVLSDREHLVGRHQAQVFGKLAGFGSERSDTELFAVSSACSNETIFRVEEWVEAERTVSGGFRVNVCVIQDGERSWTLGEGRYSATY